MNGEEWIVRYSAAHNYTQKNFQRLLAVGFCIVSVSVEQIQDRGKHKFVSTLFPQTENAPVLDIQQTLNIFYKSAFV